VGLIIRKQGNIERSSKGKDDVVMMKRRGRKSKSNDSPSVEDNNLVS
jgi:hypothetical protein